jgi:hypothetical protein
MEEEKEEGLSISIFHFLKCDLTEHVRDAVLYGFSIISRHGRLDGSRRHSRRPLLD